MQYVGKLIHIDIIKKGTAKLGAEINTRFLQLPRRVMPNIVSMIKAGTSEEEVIRHL